jgi:hypothetical protein
VNGVEIARSSGQWRTRPAQKRCESITLSHSTERIVR